MNNDARTLWDQEAETFDQAADHGLTESSIRNAWRQLLLPLFSSDHPQNIADLGCGTGTLSVLLAEAGHQVTGVDFAPNMLTIARHKAAAVHPTPVFIQADAAQPPLARSSFDTVLSRHVLWAMPDPAAALQRWRELLRPNGRLILVEGHWSTGAGLTADECEHLVRPLGGEYEIRPLDDPSLWGRAITDERYLVVCSAGPEAPAAQ